MCTSIVTVCDLFTAGWLVAGRRGACNREVKGELVGEMGQGMEANCAVRQSGFQCDDQTWPNR